MFYSPSLWQGAVNSYFMLRSMRTTLADQGTSVDNHMLLAL